MEHTEVSQADLSNGHGDTQARHMFQRPSLLMYSHIMTLMKAAGGPSEFGGGHRSSPSGCCWGDAALDAAGLEFFTEGAGAYMGNSVTADIVPTLRCCLLIVPPIRHYDFTQSAVTVCHHRGRDDRLNTESNTSNADSPDVTTGHDVTHFVASLSTSTPTYTYTLRTALQLKHRCNCDVAPEELCFPVLRPLSPRDNSSIINAPPRNFPSVPRSRCGSCSRGSFCGILAASAFFWQLQAFSRTQRA
jgi:hypothetical protein